MRFYDSFPRNEKEMVVKTSLKVLLAIVLMSVALSQNAQANCFEVPEGPELKYDDPANTAITWVGYGVYIGPPVGILFDVSAATLGAAFVSIPVAIILYKKWKTAKNNRSYRAVMSSLLANDSEPTKAYKKFIAKIRKNIERILGEGTAENYTLEEINATVAELNESMALCPITSEETQERKLLSLKKMARLVAADLTAE
jgi:hypothetical protein